MPDLGSPARPAPRRLFPGASTEALAGVLVAAGGLGVLLASRSWLPPPGSPEPPAAVAPREPSAPAPAPSPAESPAPPAAPGVRGSRAGAVHFEPPHESGPKPATATGAVAQALATPDLLARLRIVDLILNEGKFGEAEAVILALLDAPPADPIEAGASRVALLSRLGFVPHSVDADRRLGAALAPDRPRAERLVAVEALGRGQGLHPLWEQILAPVAARDADREVQRRAGVALGR